MSGSNNHWHHKTPWVAHRILKDAQSNGHPVIFLAGAGVSVDSGYPLATPIAQYLVHVDALARLRGFNSVREYIDEMKWPGRHDLRLELLRAVARQRQGGEQERVLRDCSLDTYARDQERVSSQDAMISELRRTSPTLAHAFEEVFGMDEFRQHPYREEYLNLYSTSLKGLQERLASRIPSYVGYRSLLFHLSENDQSTIDACLDHFRRDRSPTTTHQFLVFLATLLQSRVIFTTNFDSLVEEAFALEGFRPTVYEVQGDGRVPSSQMLLSQPTSIIKLHGGTHNIRTGFDLDEPLSSDVLATFNDLYSRLQSRHNGQTPLTVVLGYSGSDRRIMDIITSQIRQWRPGELERVLWVNRGLKVPRLLKAAIRSSPSLFQDVADDTLLPRGSTWEDSSSSKRPRQPAHVVNYWDGRLFLFEMYQSLTDHFPTARSRYQCINPAVPSTRTSPPSAFLRTFIASILSGGTRIGLLTGICEHQTSQSLSSTARELEHHGFNVIWIDLTEVQSVAVFIDLLSERFTKLDKRLQGLRRPLFMHDIVNCIASQGDVRTDDNGFEQRDLVLAAKWIRHALRRDKYLLAVDSLDQFPNSHQAERFNAESSSTYVSHERTRLGALLKAIVSQPTLIGDSRLVVAAKQALHSHPERQLRASAIKDGDAPYELVEDFVNTCKTQPGARVQSVDQNRTTEPTSGLQLDPPDLPSKRLAKSWPRSPRNAGGGEQIGLQGLVAALMDCIASCKRRPRSEAFLVRCLCTLIGQSSSRGHPSRSDPPLSDVCFGDRNTTSARELLHDLITSFVSTTLPVLDVAKELECTEHPSRWTQEAKEMLRRLVDTPGSISLERREGGYHWMRLRDRNAIYTWLEENARASLPMLHHIIALICIDELYERSSDPRALVEYLFHRSASLRLAAQFANKSATRDTCGEWAKCTGRLVRRVSMVLRRELDTLLANARIPALLAQMAHTLGSIVAADRELRELLDSRPPAKDARTLREVRYGIITDAGELLDVLAACLAMSGHPHQAAACHAARVRLLEQSLAGSRSRRRRRGLSDILTEPGIFNITDASSIRRAVDNVLTTTRQQCDANASAASRERFLDAVSTVSDLSWTLLDPMLWKTTDRTDEWIAECLGLIEGADEEPESNLLQRARVYDHAWQSPFICTDAGNSIARSTIIASNRKTVGAARRRLSQLCGQEWTRAEISVSPESLAALELEGRLIHREREQQLCDHVDFPVLRAWAGTAPIHAMPLTHASIRRITDASTREGPIAAGHERHKILLKWIERYKRLQKSVEWHDRGEMQPILRASKRLKRYECYRLCVLGRLQSTCDLASDFDVLPEVEASIEPCSNWEKVRRFYESAESVLHRQGDAADRQALGVTRVLLAECMVRRAETALHYTERLILQHSKPSGQSTRVATVLDHRIIRVRAIHAECGQLLQSIEAIMEQGRAENRWRMLHQLTLARSEMLAARLHKLRADPEWRVRVSLFSAARQLIGALTNTGIYTQRWTLLRVWWDAWQASCHVLLDGDAISDRGRSPESRPSSTFIEDVRARLGVQWCGLDARDRLTAGSLSDNTGALATAPSPTA